MITNINNALWLMTGNNPKLSDELSRRCVRVRIDPQVDRPWLRAKFKHKAIANWAKQNRSALVHAVLTLVQAWIAAGKPMHAASIGSFESWSAIVGGVLDVAQIPGFLGNLDELYETADGDGQTWREFTSAWWEAYRDAPKRVSELNQLCEQRELMLNARGDGSPRSQQTRLGNALGNHRDRVFNGLAIKRVSIGKRSGAFLYALVQVNKGDDHGSGDQSSLDLIDSIESADPAYLAYLPHTSFLEGMRVSSALETATSEPPAYLAYLPAHSTREKINSLSLVGDIDGERENFQNVWVKSGQEVCKVCEVSVSNTNDEPYTPHTSVSEVCGRYARYAGSADSGKPDAIDLANLPGDWDTPDREPP